MASELLRFSKTLRHFRRSPFSVIGEGELSNSGEARKSAVFSSPWKLLRNYFEDNCGEARKTCFSASPLQVASLPEKVAHVRRQTPFGGLAA